MKSNYSFEKKESYLSLTISGEYDKTDFLSYPKLIKDECKKEGTHKVLVNALNVTRTNPDTMERFFFGERFLKFPKQMAVGFFDRISCDFRRLFLGEDYFTPAVLFLAFPYVGTAALHDEFPEQFVVEENLLGFNLIVLKQFAEGLPCDDLHELLLQLGEVGGQGVNAKCG